MSNKGETTMFTEVSREAPTMTNDILREETVYQPIKNEQGKITVCGGKRLYMADGSVWFHPYSGGTPIQERRPKRLFEKNQTNA